MKKKPGYHSLRLQIAIFILLGTFLFCSLILFFTYRYVNRILTESLIHEGQIVGANIGEIAAEKLIENDVVALRSIIEKYKYYANIEYILIEDFNNQVKTDTYNGQIPAEILAVDRHSAASGGDNKIIPILIPSQNTAVYDILQPVKDGLLGFVRVGMKKSNVDDKIRETLLFLGMVFVIGTFLAIILALIIITLQVSRPIAYLTDMAHKISMGDFNSPVVLKTRNEIGILGEAVERMRESLKTSLERLRRK